jgi:hypothetical protein
MFQLEESCTAFCVHVIADGRAAELDGLPQNVQQTGVKLLQFTVRQ